MFGNCLDVVLRLAFKLLDLMKYVAFVLLLEAAEYHMNEYHTQDGRFKPRSAIRENREAN